MNDAATKKQKDPKGRGTPITDLVIADLVDRKELGTAKYGEPLLAFNGRDPVVDLYQELIDAVLYVRQYMVEDQGKELIELRAMLTAAAELAWQNDVIDTGMEFIVGPENEYADKEDWIEGWLYNLVDHNKD